MQVFFGFCVKWHIKLRGLFNPKAILEEEQSLYYLTYSWEGKEFLFDKWKREMRQK